MSLLVVSIMSRRYVHFFWDSGTRCTCVRLLGVYCVFSRTQRCISDVDRMNGSTQGKTVGPWYRIRLLVVSGSCLRKHGPKSKPRFGFSVWFMETGFPLTLPSPVSETASCGQLMAAKCLSLSYLSTSCKKLTG